MKKSEIPAPVVAQKFRNQATYERSAREMEKPVGDSLTVPDEAYSVRDILEKFTQGIDPSISKVGYDGEEDADHDDVDMEQLLREDIIEKEIIVREMNSKLEAERKRLSAERVKKDREEFERQVDAEIERRKKASQSEPSPKPGSEGAGGTKPTRTSE